MLGFFNVNRTLELTWLTKSTLSVDTVLEDEMGFIKELWDSNVG